ncbi:MAG TPA: type II toxin-antitoxin system PemK/MazF family toxin [Longimicrobium sp.]
MGAFSAGAVVLVQFPFSDLTRSKMRPAVVLANAGRGDYVLCQITSNAQADRRAVELGQSDLVSGSLQRTSYVRPAKLFTANDKLVARQVGSLSRAARARVVHEVVDLLEQQ